MAANFFEVADQNGEYDDWVELYNSSENPINIGNRRGEAGPKTN